MNNNVVEKTLKSIDNIDRLSDLAAISIYNTSHEAIDKFDVMQEHATPEYVEGEFVQESLLTGVLIGAGIIGVAISAFLIIKKIIESKAKGDPNAAPNSIKGADLRNPDDIDKAFTKWEKEYFGKYPDMVIENIKGASPSALGTYAETLTKEADEFITYVNGIVELFMSGADKNMATDEQMVQRMHEFAESLKGAINIDQLEAANITKDTIGILKSNAISIAKSFRDFDNKINESIKTFEARSKQQHADSEDIKNATETMIKNFSNALKSKAKEIGAIMDSIRSIFEGFQTAIENKVKEAEGQAKAKQQQELTPLTDDEKQTIVKSCVNLIKNGYEYSDEDISHYVKTRHVASPEEIQEIINAVRAETNGSPKESTGSPEPGPNHSQDDESTSDETDEDSAETKNSETPEGTPKTEPAADKESDDSDRAPIELNGDMKPIIVKACKDQGVPDNYANQYADIIVKNRDLNALRQHLNAGHTGEHKAENDAQTEELINAIRNALYDSLSDTDDESSTGTELTDAEKTKLISEMQSKIPGFNEYTFNRIYDNLKEGTAETITKDIASQAFEELFDSANKINLRESGKRVNEILSKKYALYEFIAKKANIDFSKFNVTKPDLSMLEFNQLVPIFDDVMAGKKTPYQGINEAIKIVLAKYGFDEEQHPTEDMESSSETPETPEGTPKTSSDNSEDKIKEIVSKAVAAGIDETAASLVAHGDVSGIASALGKFNLDNPEDREQYIALYDNLSKALDFFNLASLKNIPENGIDKFMTPDEVKNKYGDTSSEDEIKNKFDDTQVTPEKIEKVVSTIKGWDSDITLTDKDRKYIDWFLSANDKDSGISSIIEILEKKYKELLNSNESGKLLTFKKYLQMALISADINGLNVEEINAAFPQNRLDLLATESEDIPSEGEKESTATSEGTPDAEPAKVEEPVDETEKKGETPSAEETTVTPEAPKEDEQSETSSEESNGNDIKKISDSTGLDEGKVEGLYKILKDNSTPDDVKRAFIIDTIRPMIHMPGFNQKMANDGFKINYDNFKKVAEAASIPFEIEQPEISEKDINDIHTIISGTDTEETKLAKIADNLMNATSEPESEILNTADTTDAIESPNQDQNKPPTQVTSDDLIAAKNANIDGDIAERIAYAINNNKDMISTVIAPAMGTLLADINERPLNSFERSQYLKTYDALVKAFNYFHLDPNQYLDPEKYPDPKSLGILSDEEEAKQKQKTKWWVDLANELGDYLSDNKTIAEFISDKKISEQDVVDALKYIGMGEDISVPIDENKVRRVFGFPELKTQTAPKAQPSSPSNSSTGSRGSNQQPAGKPVNKPKSEAKQQPANKPGFFERSGQFLGL